MNRLIVLIGDIVKSRRLDTDPRLNVQNNLVRTFGTINNESRSLTSSLTITLGDEFQAVYENGAEILGHTWEIMAALHPVTVRFAIGIGTITTPINPKQAIGMDGTAFHAARRGIERLKENEYLYQIESDRENDPVEKLMNHSLHLLSSQMRGWNTNRFHVLHMMQKGVHYKKIAARLGISESAIYKNRESGSLDILLEMEKVIGSLLSETL